MINDEKGYRMIVAKINNERIDSLEEDYCNKIEFENTLKALEKESEEVDLESFSRGINEAYQKYGDYLRTQMRIWKDL